MFVLYTQHVRGSEACPSSALLPILCIAHAWTSAYTCATHALTQQAHTQYMHTLYTHKCTHSTHTNAQLARTRAHPCRYQNVCTLAYLQGHGPPRSPSVLCASRVSTLH